MSFAEDCWNDNDTPGTRKRAYSAAFGEFRGGYRAGPLPSDGSVVPSFFGPPPRPLMFPGGPRGPPPMFGRGFGPGGPPNRKFKDDATIKYLMACGIPKNALKNIPSCLLNIMEPEHCGLCGYDFDSFALSRVHYLSKNHQKSQKKWLSKNNDIFKNHEAPLKSRDIYCELCDVEITSKVHADSHYSGKSHHAIILGRKNPKNPILLQPGMERRLQQLIRREKKFLNKPEETAVEEVKDNKPLVPELYCDICKTTVTCSEQMTMHLNGKKHLNREKQFILKRMKGETGGSNEIKPEPSETAANETGDEEMNAEEWKDAW